MKRKGYTVTLGTSIALGQHTYNVKRSDGTFVAGGSAYSAPEAARIADAAVQRDRAKQKLLPGAEAQP